MANQDEAPAEQSPAIYFREWRLHRGLTQAQVQRRFGWTEGRLSKLESGAVPPKAATLSGLAKLYGCEMGDLFAPPPSLPAVGSGLFGIIEMRRLIIRLQQDMAELKSEVLPRIEAIASQLAEADTVSAAAAKNAEELAELFGRYASKIPHGADQKK